MEWKEYFEIQNSGTVQTNARVKSIYWNKLKLGIPVHESPAIVGFYMLLTSHLCIGWKLPKSKVTGVILSSDCKNLANLALVRGVEAGWILINSWIKTKPSKKIVLQNENKMQWH